MSVRPVSWTGIRSRTLIGGRAEIACGRTDLRARRFCWSDWAPSPRSSRLPASRSCLARPASPCRRRAVSCDPGVELPANDSSSRGVDPDHRVARRPASRSIRGSARPADRHHVVASTRRRPQDPGRRQPMRPVLDSGYGWYQSTRHAGPRAVLRPALLLEVTSRFAPAEHDEFRVPADGAWSLVPRRRIDSRTGARLVSIHGRQGRVIYVGKAKSLRSRLSNYFVQPELLPSARARW